MTLCRCSHYRHKLICHYVTLLYGKLREQDEPNRALWLATRAGKMELSYPLRTTRRVLREKFPRKPNNKSFIDQACSVKMAGYWPRSFLRVYETPKKRTRPISSHLHRTSLVNNQYRGTQIQMIVITLLVVLEVHLLQLIHAFQQVPENYNYCGHRLVCLNQRTFHI